MHLMIYKIQRKISSFLWSEDGCKVFTLTKFQSITTLLVAFNLRLLFRLGKIVSTVSICDGAGAVADCEAKDSSGVGSGAAAGLFCKFAD